jgi:heme exporter protein D
LASLVVHAVQGAETFAQTVTTKSSRKKRLKLAKMLASLFVHVVRGAETFLKAVTTKQQEPYRNQ